MPTHILAIKEEGTHTPAEGLLARFARIRAIKSRQDLLEVARTMGDVVLIDIRMPSFDGAEVLEAIAKSKKCPLIMLFDSEKTPSELLRQFSKLSVIASPPSRRTPGLAQIINLLGLSQESLARLVGVSARTVHRWLRGARPRPRPELDQLAHFVQALYRVFPNDDAIRAYLRHPNPALNQERPLDLLGRADFARVAADLQAIEEGVYI